MFCKWCGTTITTSEKCCPKCGRETPPMSDCGGLYNLKQPVAVPVQREVTPPKCPIVEKLEARYEKDRQVAQKRHTVLMTCFAVTLVVMIALLVIGIGLITQVGILEGKLDALKESTATLDTEPSTAFIPSDTTTPTEATTPMETTNPTNPTETTEPEMQEDNTSQ